MAKRTAQKMRLDVKSQKDVTRFIGDANGNTRLPGESRKRGNPAPIVFSRIASEAVGGRLVGLTHSLTIVFPDTSAFRDRAQKYAHKFPNLRFPLNDRGKLYITRNGAGICQFSVSGGFLAERYGGLGECVRYTLSEVEQFADALRFGSDGSHKYGHIYEVICAVHAPATNGQHNKKFSPVEDRDRQAALEELSLELNKRPVVKDRQREALRSMLRRLGVSTTSPLNLDLVRFCVSMGSDGSDPIDISEKFDTENGKWTLTLKGCRGDGTFEQAIASAESIHLARPRRKARNEESVGAAIPRKPNPWIPSWKLVEPASAADPWLLRVFARSRADPSTEYPMPLVFDRSKQREPKQNPINALRAQAVREITRACPEFAEAIGIHESELSAQAGHLTARSSNRLSKPIDANEHQLSVEDACRFITEWAVRLRELGHDVFIPTSLLGESTQRLIVIRRSPVDQRESSGLFSANNLLNFRWDVVLNGQPIDVDELERMAELKRPLIQWRGKWIFFDPQQWSAEKLLQIAEHLRQHPVEQLQLSIALQSLLAKFQEWNGVPLETVEGDECQWIARLTHRIPFQDVPKPDGLQAELRHYQQDGLNWLAFMAANGFGACLADDMGLGKTLQTLA